MSELEELTPDFADGYVDGKSEVIMRILELSCRLAEQGEKSLAMQLDLLALEAAQSVNNRAWSEEE